MAPVQSSDKRFKMQHCRHKLFNVAHNDFSHCAFFSACTISEYTHLFSVKKNMKM